MNDHVSIWGFNVLIQATLVVALGTVTLAVGQQEEPATQLTNPTAPTTDGGQGDNAVSMRGRGADRQMLITGSVVDTDGQPAREYELLANLRTQSTGRRMLPAEIAGGQFRIWVPISSSQWFYLELSASTADGKRRAFQGIAISRLRQAAIEGVNLVLSSTTRTVQVDVKNGEGPVAGAHVIAQFEDSNTMQRHTGPRGTATFELLAGEKLRLLTAWTDDFQLGGYLFNRKPRRDPLGDAFTIELDDCRDQVLRLVEADNGTPVAGVQFALTVGTGPPNYNFPGTGDTLPQAMMTTDQQGEVVYPWFPDWEKHGSYVELADPRWAKAGSNEMAEDGTGALVVKLKRRVSRQPLAGQIVSDDNAVAVGGLLIKISTFQGEEERRSDQLHVFTDQDGRFTADCIPGSTYCVYVDDQELVSNTIDLIPFEPATGKSNAARLHASQGTAVEIRVTSGPRREPIQNQWVNLRATHAFTWRENGETRHGRSGRQWTVLTDQKGIARTRALAGAELHVNVYAGEWRSGEKEITVDPVGANAVEFHREIASARDVTGKLIPPPAAQVDMANAEIVFGSIGGETDERETMQADEHGNFTFATKAVRVGIFAYTADGTAAGIARPQDVNQPVELHLKPTSDLRGQLLGSDGQPLAGHWVRVRPRVEAEEQDYDKAFVMSFATRTFEARTDFEGKYALSDLPSELAMTLQADPVDGSESEVRLDELFLRVGEVRAPLVSRLAASREPDRTALVERYHRVLRDAALGDFHLLVLIYDAASTAFVENNLLDYSKTRQVGSFMILQIRDAEMAEPAGAEFVAAQKWPSPVPGTVVACALDGAGVELGRVRLPVTAAGAAAAAADFLSRYSPPQADAEQKWSAAFAEAKRSNRKVWARVSQRYCGPCFRMARWLDDHREQLEQDYVLLKIDNIRDQSGQQVAARIVDRRRGFGIPFHAIFDADERRIIDSESPIGNIGHPSGYEGRRHVTKMLSDTRSKLSAEEIDRIVSALE